MDDMVERVARAISGAPFSSKASIRKARAAIAAMREPSPKMVKKALSLLRSNLRYEEVYRHMIDAALASPADKDAA